MIISKNDSQRVFIISDTHFGHDKDFVYKKRGFSSVQEMNEAIVSNWNEVVMAEDIVFHLGDVYLNKEENVEYLAKLKGHIHLIRGNHDTDRKVERMLELRLVESVSWADTLHYNKKHFYLSHYPTLCSDINLSKENLEKSIRERTLCLYGHTHQDTNFWKEVPWMYHVGVDSHHCKPVLIDDIIAEMLEKKDEKLFELRRHVKEHNEEVEAMSEEREETQ